MGEKDLNARKPRGILGLYFLFSSSGKPETTGKQNPRISPYGVPDGKPKRQRVPEHPSLWESVPESHRWRGKASAPRMSLEKIQKKRLALASVARMARNIWQASQNPRIPESQKMVLTVPTINQNINRSPLFCYYQNFKPSQIEFLKVKCKNIF